MVLKYFFWTVAGFFSGSVMYSYLLPKLFFKQDVREKTLDGNPGTSNAFHKFGAVTGAFCLILELAKGALPVYFAAKHLDIANPLFSAVIAAPVFGHAFTPMFGFQGGKAIAPSFGVLLGLLPHSGIAFLLAAVFLFFSIIIIIKPYAMRILFVYSVFLLVTFKTDVPLTFLGGAALSSAVVCFKHKKGMIFHSLQLFFFKTPTNEHKEKK